MFGFIFVLIFNFQNLNFNFVFKKSLLIIIIICYSFILGNFKQWFFSLPHQMVLFFFHKNISNKYQFKGHVIYMGKDKFENEELLRWGWPEDCK